MSAPSIEPLVAAIAKLVDREVKRHGYDAMQVCGALGATAGAIVGVNLPDARFDPFMLGALGMGFQEVVTGARKKAAN